MAPSAYVAENDTPMGGLVLGFAKAGPINVEECQDGELAMGWWLWFGNNLIEEWCWGMKLGAYGWETRKESNIQNVKKIYPMKDKEMSSLTENYPGLHLILGPINGRNSGVYYFSFPDAEPQNFKVTEMYVILNTVSISMMINIHLS